MRVEVWAFKIKYEGWASIVFVGFRGVGGGGKDFVVVVIS